MPAVCAIDQVPRLATTWLLELQPLLLHSGQQSTAGTDSGELFIHQEYPGLTPKIPSADDRIAASAFPGNADLGAETFSLKKHSLLWLPWHVQCYGHGSLQRGISASPLLYPEHNSITD